MLLFQKSIHLGESSIFEAFIYIKGDELQLVTNNLVGFKAVPLGRKLARLAWGYSTHKGAFWSLKSEFFHPPHLADGQVQEEEACLGWCGRGCGNRGGRWALPLAPDCGAEEVPWPGPLSEGAG